MDENEKYHVTTGKIHGMNPPNSWDEVRPSEQKVAEHHWQKRGFCKQTADFKLSQSRCMTLGKDFLTFLC